MNPAEPRKATRILRDKNLAQSWFVSGSIWMITATFYHYAHLVSINNCKFRR